MVVEKEDDKEPHFVARARLMLLLGEQLITDEVAAVSELVKNAYDADATYVKLNIENVSSKDSGSVTIIDNGHGMDRDTIVGSWLELGTLSKARGTALETRRSKSKKRPYLGEKGLGRLSVHKIGKVTKLVSRTANSKTETSLVLDWSEFEDPGKYLDDIKIKIEEGPPQIFTQSNSGFEHGTMIQMSKLQRDWSSDSLKRIKQFIMTMQSPFSDVKDFNVELTINDATDTEMKFQDIQGLLKSAHYVYRVDVNGDGTAKTQYAFQHPLYGELNTTRSKTLDIRSIEQFPVDRKPICGPLKMHLYCWDLDAADKRATFGEGRVYETVVRPQTGVKLFRDGFRVFPYGSEDNDWLSMDQRRIERFQENISRNQIIGYVEISSKDNPYLIDKSDREGLIDNDAFREFKSLVINVLINFQAEREVERNKVKEMKRVRTGDPRGQRFSRQLQSIVRTLDREQIPVEKKLVITEELRKTLSIFDQTVSDIEEGLFGAASIGLTYAIPTHEIRRNLQECMKALRRIEKSEHKDISEEVLLLKHLVQQSDEILDGIVKMSQRVREQEEFFLKKPIENALQIMNPKLSRNQVETEPLYRSAERIKGSERLIALMLINMIDNSIYWLGRKKPQDRKLRIIVTRIGKEKALIVSDTGPGIEDDLEILTMPFFTRKEKGMGLGLYICNRIAELHNAHLKIMSPEENSDLLSGANIAIIFKGD